MTQTFSATSEHRKRAWHPTLQIDLGSHASTYAMTLDEARALLRVAAK